MTLAQLLMGADDVKDEARHAGPIAPGMPTGIAGLLAAKAMR